MVRLMIYLYSGHSWVLSNQDPSVKQFCYLGVIYLQEVPYNFCDVHLPVSAQHEGGLTSWFGRLSYKVCQDFEHSMLVLKSAAPSSPVLIIFIFTLPCGPDKEIK